MNISFITYWIQKVRPQRIMVRIQEDQTTHGPPSLAMAREHSGCDLFFRGGKAKAHMVILYFKLAYVVLHLTVKEFFKTHF